MSVRSLLAFTFFELICECVSVCVCCDCVYVCVLSFDYMEANNINKFDLV